MVRDPQVSQQVALTCWTPITEHLGDHPALLVLDSCEHRLDAVAELVAGARGLPRPCGPDHQPGTHLVLDEPVRRPPQGPRLRARRAADTTKER
jgi:hypothetical protein